MVGEITRDVIDPQTGVSVLERKNPLMQPIPQLRKKRKKSSQRRI